MKVSLYSTVLNEESSIRVFLDSLLDQSRPPDEIVIVDGGSTDRTTEIIEEYVERGIGIGLIVKKGLNVAQGRNEGIRNCRHEIVASADAGCRLDKDWLRNLIAAFDEQVDVVSGVYLPNPQNTFEECVGDILYPNIEGLPEEWSSPSHRSVAFRKKVWEAIGPIPERLYRSEDTWFNLKAKERGFRFKLAGDAIVYWRPRKNLGEVHRNVYLWTKSDIENDVQADVKRRKARRHLLRITWRLLALLVLLFCGAYLSWLAALLIAPFVFREMISFYPGERPKRKIYKNLIKLAVSLGYVRGYMAASWRLLRMRRHKV